MARSYPTLEQRRSNAAFASSRSGLPSGASTEPSGARYTNAAKRLWQLSDDWETNLLMNVFGPRLVGSIAAAIDPLFKFIAGSSQIDVVRRRRTREVGQFVCGYTAITHIVRSTNTHGIPGDGSPLVDEYIIDDVFEDDSVEMSSSNTTHTTFTEDSTDKLRASGTFFNEMESCTVSKVDWKEPPKESFTFVNTYLQQFPDGSFVKRVETCVCTSLKGGPTVPIVGNFGFDGLLKDLNSNLKQFAADNLQDYLPQCLSSNRLFNSFYQIGELKDLPMMIEKTLSTQRFLRDLIKDPKYKLMHLDKASGDAYLNYLFGYKSLEQAVKSLCRLPEKLAKRFNYLLRKNHTKTSQRFTKVYTTLELGELAPQWTIMVPPQAWAYTSDETVETVDQKLELRCVVNSTINMPELAVPKFSDSTFRDMIGLTPRLIDLYNLVPWTWLSDWFVGVGKYLDLVESIYRDRDLINVGFLTAIYDVSYKIGGDVHLAKTYDLVTDEDGNVISEEWSTDEYVFPFYTSASMKYRFRFSLDDLTGVKSVDNKHNQLTDQQKSILGALFTKFS